MAQLPRISIVTPSYNQGPYIEATIRSVLDQGYPNLRYIVMDGGSADQTVQILQRYENQLQWVSQKDDGQADAINRGFARVEGEILGWLNSDDTLAPGALHLAGEYLRDHPKVTLVYGQANFIDPRGKYLGRCAHIEPFNHHRLRHFSDFIVQPAAFFRRSAFEAVGGLDKSLHWSMDYDLWLKLASAGYAMQYIAPVLANYRWFGGNKSAIGGMKRLEEIQRVVERHGIQKLPAYFCLEAAYAHGGVGLAALKAGRLTEAAGRFRRAAAAVLGSPDAMISLANPQTWQTIWTGQVLRRRTRGRDS